MVKSCHQPCVLTGEGRVANPPVNKAFSRVLYEPHTFILSLMFWSMRMVYVVFVMGFSEFCI